MKLEKIRYSEEPYGRTKDLLWSSAQLKNIRALLELNCRPSKPLYVLGCRHNDMRSPMTNLINILEQLMEDK